MSFFPSFIHGSTLLGVFISEKLTCSFSVSVPLFLMQRIYRKLQLLTLNNSYLDQFHCQHSRVYCKNTNFKPAAVLATLNTSTNNLYCSHSEESVQHNIKQLLDEKSHVHSKTLPLSSPDINGLN